MGNSSILNFSYCHFMMCVFHECKSILGLAADNPMYVLNVVFFSFLFIFSFFKLKKKIFLAAYCIWEARYLTLVQEKLICFYKVLVCSRNRVVAFSVDSSLKLLLWKMKDFVHLKEEAKMKFYHRGLLGTV